MSMQFSKGTPSYLSHADRIAAQWQDFLLLAGRVLMGWIFISNGWRKLTDIPGFIKTLPQRDLPDFMGYIAPPVEFIGGICLVLGFATRYTALVMLLFVIVATFSSHRYWNFPAAQQANQNSHFLKNFSIMGGMVFLFITGGGRFSLDRILAKR